MCVKSTIKTSEQHPSVFFVDFEEVFLPIEKDAFIVCLMFYST